jgi:hypothetical protein
MFNGLDGRRESDWPDAESNCEQVESASENLPTSGSGDSDFPTVQEISCGLQTILPCTLVEKIVI